MGGNDNFRFSIDRGGTFTDIYAETPGEPGYRVVKLLSEDPDNYDDAPREGIRRIINESFGSKLPADTIDTDRIDWIRMGTTLATNALLERKGARCGLLITKGFKDLLQIGNQNRPRIFDLAIRKPEQLYSEVVEIDERVRIVHPDSIPASEPTIQGIGGERIEILKAPDPDEINTALDSFTKQGIEAIAVLFLHAYTFPDHENMVGDMARHKGFSQISLSSRVMPMIKAVSRGDTTIVDSYLSPHIRNYINGFRSGFKRDLADANLLFMQSDGGLAPASRFTGCRAILSGPAGGVVGCAMTAHRETGSPVIGFDMGGTSTDVSRYNGELELVHETETAGIRIQAPQLDIITVAAGGGSRLFFRNGMFEVGPESAGAHPGPLCYRKNGFLAITDANIVLGRLQPEYFPNIFGKEGSDPLDLNASREGMGKLQREINQITGRKLSLEETALGFIRVANETMIRPMREISVARGYDIKDHVLACFGGAGSQHACAIARELGLSRIHIHRFSGILSAYGMGLAGVVEEGSEPASCELNPQNLVRLENRLALLSEKTCRPLLDQGYPPDSIEVETFLNLRYQGTDTALMVRRPANNDFLAAFLNEYRREFGFLLENRFVEVDNIRVRATASLAMVNERQIAHQKGSPLPNDSVSCYFDQGWTATPVYDLASLGAKAELIGPALIINDTTTIVLEPETTASITSTGDILITLHQRQSENISDDINPVQLAIFSNLFMSIAEQMGRSLQRTAISTNIKERCDFSCALFDSTGGLVANAPHQPVHLGAMSEAVRQQIRIHGHQIKDGDVIISNDPLAGGSHLPDITVITPVIIDKTPVFYVANRGHHADIGGITPGSMPPFSRTIDEEGACIKSFKLVSDGFFHEDALRELLAGSRAIEDNISDLKAQVAANRKGAELLLEMCGTYTPAVIQAYMEHIQKNCEKAVREMLKELSVSQGDALSAEDLMDDGSPIRLKITIDPENGDAVFDFTGTGPQVDGNWNTPKAVTYSAIIYVLRSLIDREIPLNQGCLNPVRTIIPEGSLLAPAEGAAVVGGNVLTSQRIVDVILKAFRAAAASQGCMNNFTFGNKSFGYYETIGGGAGAGPCWHGQSGVHSHMTNTRITDPEILEKRYPVLVKEFSIREGSGGNGNFHGGNGLIRDIEFLTELQAAILSERRVYPPYGMADGENGAVGINELIRNTGEKGDLGGKNQVEIKPGDRIRIMTPGGGGYGIKS